MKNQVNGKTEINEQQLEFSMESGWGFMLQHVLGIKTNTTQITPKKIVNKLKKITEKYINRVDNLPDLDVGLKNRLLRELEDLQVDLDRISSTNSEEYYKFACVHLFMFINLLLGYSHQTGKTYHIPYFVKEFVHLAVENEETEGKSGDEYRFFGEKSSRMLSYRKEMIDLLRSRSLTDAEIGTILKIPTKEVGAVAILIEKNE